MQIAYAQRNAVMGYSPSRIALFTHLADIVMADYDPESGLTYERPSSMVERQPNDNEK